MKSCVGRDMGRIAYCVFRIESQKLLVKIPEVFDGNWYGIGLMARIVKGLLDQRIQMLRLHTLLAQMPSEPDIREKLRNELNRLLVRVLVAAFHHIQAA